MKILGLIQGLTLFYKHLKQLNALSHTQNKIKRDKIIHIIEIVLLKRS